MEATTDYKEMFIMIVYETLWAYTMAFISDEKYERARAAALMGHWLLWQELPAASHCQLQLLEYSISNQPFTSIISLKSYMTSRDNIIIYIVHRFQYSGLKYITVLNNALP
jgi:hypothetical protein